MESNLFWAVWIELIITIIYEILETWIAWLIPHLIANNSVSVVVTLIAWWSVFLMVGVRMNIGNRYSNIVLDTSIQNDND